MDAGCLFGFRFGFTGDSPHLSWPQILIIIVSGTAYERYANSSDGNEGSTKHDI